MSPRKISEILDTKYLIIDSLNARVCFGFKIACYEIFPTVLCIEDLRRKANYTSSTYNYTHRCSTPKSI